MPNETRRCKLVNGQGINLKSWSGLAGWYDANREVNNLQATDWSGNGKHLSQGTPSSRPDLVSYNGRYVWQFDGVDDNFVGNTPTVTAVSLTAFVVCKWAAKAWSGSFESLQCIVDGDHGSASGGIVFQVRPDQGANKVGVGLWPNSSASTGLVTAVADNWHLLGLRHNVDTLTDSNMLNGGDVDSYANTRTNYTGASLSFGKMITGGNRWLQGCIAEVIIFTRLLTPQEELAINKVLKAKWGIA